jgi:hypothetical protein
MVAQKCIVRAFDGTITGWIIKSGQCPLYSKKDILSLVAKYAQLAIGVNLLDVVLRL